MDLLAADVAAVAAGDAAVAGVRMLSDSVRLFVRRAPLAMSVGQRERR